MATSNDSASSLSTHLQDNGLDPDFWIDVFKSELGITSVKSLQFLDRKLFGQLKRHVRHPWEEWALKELIGLNECENCKGYRDKLIEDKQQRQKEAEKLMKELEELQSERKSENDALMTKRIDRVRSLLDIPDDKWIHKGKSASFDIIVENLNKCVVETGKGLSKVDDLNPSGVVQNAAGGLLLRGTLLTKNPEDKIRCRKRLLNLPVNIQLNRPVMPVDTKVIELSSKKQADDFERALQSSGYSVAASVGSSYWGLSAKVGGSTSRTGETQTDPSSSKEEIYHCRVVCSLVPTGSIELQKGSLTFAYDALNELKDVEKLAESLGEDDDRVQQACELFFSAYGSHVNLDLVHVGGIYKWASTFNAKSSSSKASIKSMVQDSSNAFVSMSNSGVGFCVGASVSADYVQEEGHFKGSYNKSDISSNQLHCQTFGGPSDASSLHQWKSGLISNSSTWTIIDRGEMQDHSFHGIWDIVRNDTDSFVDKSKISKVLLKAWENMTGISIVDVNGLCCLISDMLSNVEEIIQKAEQKSSKLKYKDALQQIITERRKCEREVGNVQPWITILKQNKGISDFILKATEYTQEDEDICFIKLYIKQLIQNVDATDFPGMSKIWDWLHSEKPHESPTCILTENNFDCVNDFLIVVREKFLPDVQKDEARVLPSDREELGLLHWRITKDTSLGVDKLLRNLERKNKLEYVLMASLLQMLSYDLERRTFEVVVTSEKLNRFTERSIAKFKDFKKYEKVGEMQVHAYLLCLAIECMAETYNETTSEHLSRIVAPIETFLKKKVNLVYCASKRQPRFNSVALSDAVKKLMTGAGSAVSVIHITDLDTLSDELVISSTTDGQVERQDRHGFDEEDIARRLSLINHFPSKISVQQVIALTKEQNTLITQEQLPWLVLRKIMANDQRWRDKIIPEVQMKTQDASTSDFYTDEDPFENFSDKESDEEAKSKDILHPLDVFLAAFICCDHDLKRLIFQKLLMCKQAVPLVFSILGYNKHSFSLLPLRSLFMECKTSNQSASVVCAATHPTKIVGFVRVQSPKFSKSKLLNEVLSENSHATFCCQDLLPGDIKTMETRGLIEAAWFLPSGKESDIFSEVVTFLNLRGNAASHMEALAILSNMAFTVFVVVDITDLANQNTIKVIQQLNRSPTKTVILLTKQSEAANSETVKRSRTEFLDKIGTEIKVLQTFNILKEGLKQKSSATVKMDVRKAIATLIKKQDVCNKTRSLGDCGYDLSIQNFVLLDEETETCTSGKSMAKGVYRNLCSLRENEDDYIKLGKLPVVQSKEQFLPLQGKLWRKWSTLNKTQNKTRGQNTLYGVSKIQLTMDEIREEQIRLCCQLTPPVKEVIKNLTTNDEESRLYFVMWLKIFLNENSCNILPYLIKEFHSAWVEVRKAKDNYEDGNIMKKLQDYACFAEVQLAEASFGFEHFIRELGQIYECVMQKPEKVDAQTFKNISMLPEIAARLLIKGHALEIMDGDAANIPLTWVKAILKHLADFFGDKKKFVVSVLGIQSSGKSTLLNAVFGLQFSVSAGRCTRGVFAQLVSVEDKDLPYDYFLVVDTEGLRAPELGQSQLDHDNELATFVIGIGDVTLINIKGENTAEVKDVLQIAVHAFLRMTLANKRIELQRKCMFVHQNVGAINAGEKMLQGLKQLQEALDEMTQNAAEEENIADIHIFNQVINFRGEKDVLYFPDLWSGDPPMAPCNVGYSEKAEEVKKRLQEMALEKKGFITISALAVRIEDLWKGIMTDNFVFSFRNSLEIKAYKNMDIKYQEITGKYEEAIMTWFEKDGCNAIERCDSVENLEACYTQLVRKLTIDMTTVESNICEELENFFDNSESKELVIQWKTRRLLKFTEMAKSLLEEIKKDLTRKVDEQKLAILSKKHDMTHEKEINKRTRELAEMLQGEQPSSEYLNEKFEEMWIEWTAELIGRVPPDKEPVSVKIQKVLFEQSLEKYHKLIFENLDGAREGYNYLKEPIKQIDKLEGSWDVGDIDISADLSKKSYVGKFVGGMKRLCKIDDVTVKLLALSYTDNVFRKADDFFDNFLHKKCKFRDQHVKQLVQLVADACEEENRKDHDFNLKPPFIVKIILHICRHAITKFDVMKSRYEERYGQTAKLKAYKQTAYNLFLNTFKHEAAEVVAADFFCDQMKGKIIDKVMQSMSRKVTDKIVQDFNNSKYHLMLAMLDSLANKGNFKSYILYISDSYKFTSKWIKDYIIRKMFASTRGNISQYMALVSGVLSPMMSRMKTGISEATKSVKDSHGNKIERWVNTLAEHMKSEIGIPPDLLQNISDYNIADIVHFQNRLLAKIDDLTKSITELFEKDELETIVWPDTTPTEKVMNKLWGCKAQCPFCREPCSQNKDHLNEVSHSCIQHRPKGISGTSWEVSNKLIVESCNYDVQHKDRYFYCATCRWACHKSNACTAEKVGNGVRHKYAEYKTFIPDWDIAPSVNMDLSRYWMWFMNTYKNQLARRYGKELPDIPANWDNITKEIALTSVREVS